MPGPFHYERLGVANGCFVESVAFGDDLRARLGGATWYRLLQWGAQEDAEVVAGHAVTIFEYRGRLWCYDINSGFTVLEIPVANRANVAVVSKPVIAPYLGKITPFFPLYFEDFPQEPAPKPPVPFDGVSEVELRDASLVAARLALHRPVSLVEFTYSKDGVDHRSAAAVFVYSGRLCVYTSTSGTVPFRTKALSVENLRQLQVMLRRIYPGAGNLKTH
ncbi:MAG: hypothetical protein WC205_08250 [Opitutaceae bacterium]